MATRLHIHNRSLDSLGFKLSELQPSLFISQVSEVVQPHLSINSTLRELRLDDCRIELSEPGRKITQAFEANPLLPGVIVTEHGKFIGTISRRRFLEYMSRPFGLEVFSKRPIRDLYQFAKRDFLLLASDTSILEAAKQSLQRSLELIYEPIVVKIEPEIYCLLDAHQLLIAQSQIHELAIQMIENLNQQLEKKNQELQQLATVDSLTQTANRRQFDEYLNHKWRQLTRQHAPLSLILCDIDFFKLYNDTYGHLAGDSCLQQVANVLSRSVRRSEDLVARYGGEEFAVILPHTSTTGAISIAERIRVGVKALAIPHTQSSISSCVTLSLGIACVVPHPESSRESLIETADKALYQAKASGRDRYALPT